MYLSYNVVETQRIPYVATLFRKRTTNFKALLQKTAYKDHASHASSPPYTLPFIHSLLFIPSFPLFIPSFPLLFPSLAFFCVPSPLPSPCRHRSCTGLVSRLYVYDTYTCYERRRRYTDTHTCHERRRHIHIHIHVTNEDGGKQIHIHGSLVTTICICIFMCICICSGICICMCIYICTCTCVRICICICVCIRVCICLCLCTCICI